MELIPAEEHGPNQFYTYAEDAASAVAYTLRTLLTGEAQEAAWAARSVYEGVDAYVIRTANMDVNQRGAEEEILRHPVMQAELSLQYRDIRELSEVQKADPKEVVGRFKGRAEAESALPL
jgi:hypothetical protein